jgi:hypothetical protein
VPAFWIDFECLKPSNKKPVIQENISGGLRGDQRTSRVLMSTLHESGVSGKTDIPISVEQVRITLRIYTRNSLTDYYAARY